MFLIQVCNIAIVLLTIGAIVCIDINAVTLATTTSKSCLIDNSCNCSVTDIDVICLDGVTQLSIETTFKHIKDIKHLDTFEMYGNHLITSLPNYIFANVSFENINVFNVKSLKTVEELAFWGSVNTTKSLRLSSCSLQSTPGLFKAIAQLVYLTNIDLSDNQLEEIPDNAFGNQTQLEMITLDRNNIKVLGKYAFKWLHTLTFIDLSDNKLTKLINNTFSQQWVNYTQYSPIRINMKSNQIEDIESNTFAELNRPVTLDLSFNNLTQLTEPVFQYMLRSYETSKIIVKGNHVNCVCGLRWVYTNTTLRPKISGPLRCDDKRYFESLVDIDYKNCANNTKVLD